MLRGRYMRCYLRVGRMAPTCSSLWNRQSSLTYITAKYSTLPVSPQEAVQEGRRNPIGIQMLDESLRSQIFGVSDPEHKLSCKSLERNLSPDKVVQKIKQSLQALNLDTEADGACNDEDQSASRDSEPRDNFKIPKLYGQNLDEHFREIANQQSLPYCKLLDELVSSGVPSPPTEWVFEPGWTRYESDGSRTAVACPSESGLVFDVEVLMCEGRFPTMATAVSTKAWYSWCSDRLVNDRSDRSANIYTEDLIPMESPNSEFRIIVGHNVGFDRSFVKEQYQLSGTSSRFLDTLSLHMCVSGMTSFQRILFQAHHKGSKRGDVEDYYEKREQMSPDPPGGTDWMEKSSMNNLAAVYKLHCGGDLDKAQREIFVTGNMADVRENFQASMSYCAGDVTATHNVLSKLWPTYKERYPHPVSHAGMLEMSTAFLPVSDVWQQYQKAAEDAYQALQEAGRKDLMALADKAYQLQQDTQYQRDLWMWNQDWTLPYANTDTEKLMKRKIPPFMPGYPEWYRLLCAKPREIEKDNLLPGPSKISTSKRIAPMLLRLKWHGYPLHYSSSKHGWGYLVPGRPIDGEDEAMIMDSKQTGVGVFPLDEIIRECNSVLHPYISGVVDLTHDEMLDEYSNCERIGMTDDESIAIWARLQKLHGELQICEDEITKNKKWKKKSSFKKGQKGLVPWHQGIGPISEVRVPGCYFFKLPHSDGEGKNVGNPLSKDFIGKIEAGILTSALGPEANKLATLNKVCSYWKSNKKRIQEQMVVHLTPDDLPDEVARECSTDKSKLSVGVILPRIIPAGTITRRAVESTWMTASNAYPDRIGSELKAMVTAPPHYCFVGADVDSQELWIAGLLSDSEYGVHGATGFSWMNLQGDKAKHTDLHSTTAQVMGISRDHAKVFNYGRIYGAGRNFAKQLLTKFNPSLNDTEVKQKVSDLFTFTKGKKVAVNEDTGKKEWVNGSESALFNALESIGSQANPRTPFLHARMSQALEPQAVKSDFMTSRQNWVIQSSAVDFLHVMLVCMRWLTTKYEIDARFAISIHDEVRYLVTKEDRYRAALALQFTNLLTRCYFSHQLQMYDLPKSVAFFSLVDIDTCLRKETNMDCITPSNPDGLQKGYGIKPGESLTMTELMQQTNGCFHGDSQDMNAEPVHNEGFGSFCDKSIYSLTEADKQHEVFQKLKSQLDPRLLEPSPKRLHRVNVYTDGCCLDNGTSYGRMGIGIYWGPGSDMNIGEPLCIEGKATNNRAEIHAVVRAIQIAIEQGYKALTVYTDSAYVQLGATIWKEAWLKNDWMNAAGEPVKNKEEWLLLLKCLRKIHIRWVLVKGHSKVEGNEEADRLANIGAAKIECKIEPN